MPHVFSADRFSRPGGWRLRWLMVIVTLRVVWPTLGVETSPTNKWVVPFDFTDSSPAVGSDGIIYLGAFDQKLWAVDSNGVIRWQFQTGSEIKSSPAIGDDGVIYFGCRDRKFYAVTPQGKKKWTFTTGAWVDSSPSLGKDGTVYFGSWDKYFYALNPDGTLKWKFQTGGIIDSSPAVGNDETVYFGSHDKKFYALAPDGRKRWEYATGGPIISSPAIGSSRAVYFTSVDGFCYALNEDGSLRWRLQTGGATESSPVIGVDGTIYVGGNDSLWAVTPEGIMRNEYNNSPDPIRASPMVVGPGVVYALFYDGGMMALDTNLRSIWTVYLETLVRASPGIDSTGSLYTTCQFKQFRAWNTHWPLARSPWPKFRGNSRNTGHAPAN